MPRTPVRGLVVGSTRTRPLHRVSALSLGLYRDVLDEEAAYLLRYGEAKLVFAEDEEQVDKLLALADRVPNLKHIVYSDSARHAEIR